MDFQLVKKYSFFLFLSLIAILGLVFNQTFVGYFNQLISLLEHSSPIFISLAVLVLTLFSLPIMPVELIAGLVFGAFWGTVYVAVGALIGAVLSFRMTRYFLHDWIIRKQQAKGNIIEVVSEVIDEKGWKAIALLRLCTVIPFSLLNYVLGLTKIKTSVYTWSSAIFMLPTIWLYVYIGSLGKDYMHHNDHSLWLKFIPVFFLLLIVSYIGRKFKAKKHQVLNND